METWDVYRNVYCVLVEFNGVGFAAPASTCRVLALVESGASTRLLSAYHAGILLEKTSGGV